MFPPEDIMNGWKVELYVYDYSMEVARTWSPTIVGRQIEGLWIANVVAYGYELTYNQSELGVHRAGTNQTKPRYILDMGRTWWATFNFKAFVDKSREQFPLGKYNPINYNQNTYANHLINYLCGRPMPRWIGDWPMDLVHDVRFAYLISPQTFPARLLSRVGRIPPKPVVPPTPPAIFVPADAIDILPDPPSQLNSMQHISPPSVQQITPLLAQQSAPPAVQQMNPSPIGQITLPPVQQITLPPVQQIIRLPVPQIHPSAGLHVTLPPAQQITGPHVQQIRLPPQSPEVDALQEAIDLLQQTQATPVQHTKPLPAAQVKPGRVQPQIKNLPLQSQVKPLTVQPQAKPSPVQPPVARPYGPTAGASRSTQRPFIPSKLLAQPPSVQPQVKPLPMQTHVKPLPTQPQTKPSPVQPRVAEPFGPMAEASFPRSTQQPLPVQPQTMPLPVQPSVAETFGPVVVDSFPWWAEQEEEGGPTYWTDQQLSDMLTPFPTRAV